MKYECLHKEVRDVIHCITVANTGCGKDVIKSRHLGEDCTGGTITMFGFQMSFVCIYLGIPNLPLLFNVP